MAAPLKKRMREESGDDGADFSIEDYIGVLPANLSDTEIVRAVLNKTDTAPLQERTKITFQTLGGIGHIERVVCETITLALSASRQYDRFGVTPPKAILMTGPTGTGKSAVAEATLNFCSGYQTQRIAFFEVTGSTIWGKNSLNMLDKLFTLASKLKPSMIYVEDLPFIISRGENCREMERYLIQKLDEHEPGVFVLASAFTVGDVSAALLREGRFELVIPMPTSTNEHRVAVLEKLVNGWPGVTSRIIQQVAAGTAGKTPAQLVKMCRRALATALRRTNVHLVNAATSAAGLAKDVTFQAADFVMN